ncbi:MAG: M20 family metallopeptidase, partial [Clostridium sp.]
SVIRHHFSEEVGPCLEIRNRPEAEKIDVLLSGHMDTVFPEGTVEKRPFRREGNYAYGPGVADMKCGLVSMLYLVKEMLEEKMDLSFCVALNSDEEISSNHSKEWLKKLAQKSEYAVVMEPGRKNGEYICERKGLAKYHVEARGIAAHAGVAPQDGASAIHELANLILEITKLTDYEKGTSVNVGTISGGTGANVVSAYAECLIDTRFDAIEEQERIERALEELRVNPVDSRVTITYTREGFRPPMTMTEKTRRLMNWMDEKGIDHGMPMKWVKTGGGSDGNFIAFEGCAVIDGVGPSGEGFHGERENLQIDTIEKRLEVALETIREIYKEKEGK